MDSLQSKSITSSRPKRQRNVSFSREVEVRQIRSSWKESTNHRLWYSSDDVHSLRKADLAVVETVRKMANEAHVANDTMVHVAQRLSEHSEWNVRGLESLLDGLENKKRNRLQAVLAVLMEQDRHDMEGDGNEVAIAERYAAVTRKAQQEAYRRALMDRASINFSAATFKSISIRANRLGLTLPVVKLISPRAA